ncbi:MAG TPA: GNAT family N-acetyltransferase, partial [Beijerinckiaceae bacterium]|nr:GNAT family N-acetyltransferase [Beijerinckiaceae bacterium]
ICEALYRCVLAGHRAVLLVGDAPYYERFGFAQRLTEKLVMPGFVEKERFLGLELTPGSLVGASGVVTATGICDMPHFVPRADAFLRAA